jgi:hypothetical protein
MSGGNLSPHQFAYDFCACLVIRFDAKPRGGYMVNKDEGILSVPRKETVHPITAYMGRIFRYFSFKNRVFFISHIGHFFLLRFKQFDIHIPALHCVKYLDGLLINHIIHNFKQVVLTIEAEQQMLVRLP